MKTVDASVSIILSLSVLLLAGCRFGHDTDGWAALAKKKRQLNYQVTVALPSMVANGETIEDLGPEGMNVNWGEEEALAVMGKEFLVQKDTTGAALWPYPERLYYNRYRSADPGTVGGYTTLSFDFSAYATHSIGEDYATLINFVYPYDKVTDKEGQPLKARVDSIPFSFTGQDGTLANLRKKYFVALGRGRGICAQANVTVRDSAVCLAGHDHITWANEMLLMEPKMAIVRLSLVVPAQEDFTLLDYLSGLNMSGGTYYVDKILVSNQSAGAKGIARTLLDLNTGWMQPQGTSASYLMVEDKGRFWKHAQIRRDEAQPLADVGGTGESWGTSIYLAVPCTDEGTLAIEPLITVYVNKTDGTATQSLRYYGKVEATTLREGGYYITSPIVLYSSLDKVQTVARMWRTGKK